jgi:hypothetical protein
MNQIVREEWAETYQNIMDDLSQLLKTNTLKSDANMIFERYNLDCLSEMMNKYSAIIDNPSDFFYTLSNFLSKYPEIYNSGHDFYLSIVDGNKISLVLLKTSNKDTSKLNLIFTPENKVDFSFTESNDDELFIYGTVNAPKRFFSNQKIEKLINMLND